MSPWGSPGSSSTAGGIGRALSAADGRPRNAIPAPSNNAARANAERNKADADDMCCLLDQALDETDYRVRHIRLLAER